MRLPLFVHGAYFLCFIVCFQSGASDPLPSRLKNPLYRQNLFGTLMQAPITILKKDLQNKNTPYLPASGQNSEENAVKKETLPASPTALEQAIHHLHNTRYLQASKILLELLESDSSHQTSRAKRVITYNLALAYFWQDEKGKTLAYLRRLVFFNPYSPLPRKTLSQMGDRFVFWLWIPPEPVGILLTVMVIITLILLGRKKYSLLMGLAVPFLGLYSAGFWYFYKRGQSYATVTKDSVCLSSPDEKSPQIGELESTVLVQVLRTTQDESSTWWYHVRSGGRQTGWVPEDALIPLRPR